MAARPPVSGRSLGADAIRRLRANRAAVASLVFLIAMAIVCAVGPHLTGHAYDEVYQSYVRVPASLTPYPHEAEIAPELEKTLARARLDTGAVSVEGGRASIEVSSASRPLDPRITRYVDRNDLFANARLVDISADGHAGRIVADVRQTWFLFGTDLAGRDLLTRTLMAGRISLTIGLLATLVAMLIGVTWGAVAGYLGGTADALMMRTVDVLYALPFIFFVILLVVFFGRNFVLMFLAVGAVEWLDMARIVRGQTLSLKRREFVEAAVALGVTGGGIVRRHIVPNLAGPVVVYMTLLVPKVILLESFLSFLGLGVQEPMTSWGVLIAEGARSIEAMPGPVALPRRVPDLDAVRPQFPRRRPARRARPEGALTMDAPVLVTTEAVFALRDLKVTFDTPDGPVEAVRGIDLEVARGETLAVVGESGSGKSQAVMAAMGLLPANARVSGSVAFRGREILGLAARDLNRLRGSRITMIFQEPMTSLDPLYTIGRQMAEPLVEHGGLSWQGARERVLELLRLVGIDAPERRAASYPHEMSGGQRQRVMIAMALANRPDVLIADEPTTALDVTTQASILNLLKDLQERMGLAIVFITHDLNIVRRIADRVAVMKEGRVVEQGLTERVFAAPADAYTRMLLDAEPCGRKEPVPAFAPVLMEAEDVSVSFEFDAGTFASPSRFIAVDGVSLVLREGQTLGVVGESGSGKSTLGRALLHLLPSGGRVTFEGADLSRLGAKSLRRLRREMQLVFQDPYGSLSRASPWRRS